MDKIFNEIFDAYQNRGICNKEKEDTLKNGESNKALHILDGKYMPRTHTLNKYRNIGIMAHIDAGNYYNRENSLLQAKVIKLVKFMMELQQWTGWNKNKKENNHYIRSNHLFWKRA